ncbi:MAG: ABC transporter permease [Candidatus Berkelbacteria bacterium]|nr:ABC transporter permease [Candidatus Berkelbacteria bacterium]
MLKLFITNLKMMVRGRQALFWALAFPLLFTVIFGYFFGGGSVTVGTVALINNSKSTLAQNYEKALNESGILKVKKDVNEQEARDLLKKNQIGAIVVVPEKFGEMSPDAPRQIKIIEDPSNAQIVAGIIGFTNQFLVASDFQIANIKPSFSVNEEKTTQKPLSYFDFILMGLIGLALMNASVQGIAITMANYREDKILKRITTTPLKTWKFIVAEILSRLFLNLIQVSFILAIGHYGFHAHIYGNILLIYAFALLGGLLFQSIGFTVTALSKSTDSAQGMSIFITIPMMFLAGVFFPIDQLPKWLFSIVQYLPLAPLLRMIRQIGLEDTSPFTNPLNIIIVGMWIVIMFLISLWRFRLSDE